MKEWWSDPANRESYPGSSFSAFRWLQCLHSNDVLDIRLTEKHAESCERLRQTLASQACIKQESFAKELDWLTTADDLVLLVDPFGCVTSFSGAASGRRYANGWTDHAAVRRILRRCAGKERAVVSFWWGFGHALRRHHRATSHLLMRWAQQHGNAICRVFHDGHNHANALVGIGGGTEVVRGVPGRLGWKDSWLHDTVYEKTGQKKQS